MCIHIQWDNNDAKVLRYTILEGWEADELMDSFRKAALLRDNATLPINLIIDVDKADSPPLGCPLAPYIKLLLDKMPDKIDRVVIVGNNILVKNLAFILVNSDNDARRRVFFAVSLERARAILNEPYKPAWSIQVS